MEGNNNNNNNNPARLIHEVEYYMGNAARALEENGLYNLAIACDNVSANFRQPEYEYLYRQFLNDVRNISDLDKENVKATVINMKNNHGSHFMYEFLDIFNVEH
jgi:hypothetical protein